MSSTCVSDMTYVSVAFILYLCLYHVQKHCFI